MDRGSWHGTGSSDQDHPQEKEMQMQMQNLLRLSEEALQTAE